jgi:hypothetical protein
LRKSKVEKEQRLEKVVEWNPLWWREEGDEENCIDDQRV